MTDKSYDYSSRNKQSSTTPEVNGGVSDFDAAFGEGFPTKASEMDKVPF